jgi:hypothetical protein
MIPSANKNGCPPRESGVKTKHWKRSTALALLLAMLGHGCAGPDARLQYLLGEDRGLEHYEDYATNIEYPTQTESHEINPELLQGAKKSDESGRC